MRSRARARRPVHAGIATLAIALGWLSGAGAGRAAADPVVSPVEQAPSAVRAYWTPQRMRSAQPATLLERGPLDISGARAAGASRSSGKATLVNRTSRYPNRTNGKVFMTVPEPALDAGDYECSGTAVRSHGRSLVWTAGHCGYDPGPFPVGCGCFVTNFEFVPAYHDGAKPFGEWPARPGGLATTSQWKDSGNSAFDFTAATVAPRNGKRLEDVVGARRIAFGQPRRLLYTAYGYPDEAPFDGQHLYRCVSGYQGADGSVGPPSPIRIECDMTEGASGGGWVVRRRHRHHFRHYLVSVASYGYLDDPDHLYGPYQGTAARDLYRSAGG
jgi:hypothetical protein